MVFSLHNRADGVANPDWVLHTANGKSSVASEPNVKLDDIDRADQRRAVLHDVLAVKLLDSHLRNRVQLMQRDPTDLSGVSDTDAAMLIRAMAAAGHADGGLEQAERERLVDYARASLLDDEVRRSVLTEIERPPSIESLIRQIETPQIAERFYAVSVAVIHRESPVCRAYLAYLAVRLDLSNDVVLRLNREVDRSNRR